MTLDPTETELVDLPETPLESSANVVVTGEREAPSASALKPTTGRELSSKV